MAKDGGLGGWATQPEGLLGPEASHVGAMLEPPDALAPSSFLVASSSHARSRNHARIHSLGLRAQAFHKGFNARLLTSKKETSTGDASNLTKPGSEN